MRLRRSVLGSPLGSILLWSLGLALSTPAGAQAAPRPQPYCIRGVALDRTGERKATLVLRDGTISAVLDEAAPAPPGTRVIEGAGLLCLPAFLDAYSRQGCTVPQPVKDQDLPPNELADAGIDMRLANRKGIQPAFRAAEALAIPKEQSEAWRKSGFGALLVAPGGELLAGSSTLATTREAAMRDVVVRDEVFAHAAFAANGPGYPSTLMGYFAQLRQFLLDSARQNELQERYEGGRPGTRPPFDEQLAAGAAIVAGSVPLLCEANESEDVERWLRLFDEFGVEPSIVGGLEAWRVKDALAERGMTVVLTLDWGKEVKDPRPKEKKEKDPKEAEEEGAAAPEPEETAHGAKPEAEAEEAEPIWEYEEPYSVRLERRTKWEEGRDCALRLHDAGVRFVFGTASAKPKELLERVRTLVEGGLPAEAALTALTRDAAEFLGVGRRLGRIEPGFDATFTLWRADPLSAKDASAAWVFVDGFPSEFKEEEKGKKGGKGPGEGVDPTGSWKLEFVVEGEGIRGAELTLEMEKDGALTGTIEVENPMGGARTKSDVEGQVTGDELELECTLAFGDFEIETTLTATIDGDSLEGDGSFHGPWSAEPRTQSFSGKRTPE
jgi:imidazolonepropionase-like amidohydrolase